MAHKFTWILPANFMCKDGKPLEFDMTAAFKLLVKNKFWDRKITYEKEYYFTEESLKKIKAVKIVVFPRHSAFFSITNKSQQLFNEHFGEMPMDFAYVYDRGNLRVAKALCFVEILDESETPLQKNHRKADEYSAERYLEINMESGVLYLELVSVSNEIASLFMAANHITFLTKDHYIERQPNQSSGLIVREHDGQRYFIDRHADILSYPILLETGKLDLLKERIGIMASVWHKNLWTIHRFLKALRSDHISIDNLMDLVFTIESLFDKNTSSEMMRMAGALLTTDNYPDAKETDETISTAFSIRNAVAHGGVCYAIGDTYRHKKRDVFLMTLFWEIKFITTTLIIFALGKLLRSKQAGQQALRIEVEDLYQLYFLGSGQIKIK